MSWSCSVPATPGPQFAEAVEAAPVNGFSDNAELAPQVREQVALAKQIAKDVFVSGAVGVPERAYRATLNGHANPAHEPVDGYVNDCITVTVNQT